MYYLIWCSDNPMRFIWLWSLLSWWNEGSESLHNSGSHNQTSCLPDSGVSSFHHHSKSFGTRRFSVSGKTKVQRGGDYFGTELYGSFATWGTWGWAVEESEGVAGGEGHPSRIRTQVLLSWQTPLLEVTSLGPAVSCLSWNNFRTACRLHHSYLHDTFLWPAVGRESLF